MGRGDGSKEQSELQSPEGGNSGVVKEVERMSVCLVLSEREGEEQKKGLEWKAG